MADSLRYELLGPLRVWREDVEIALGGAKQQTVLAVLLLEPNRPVPVQKMIRTVWGSEPPPSVTHLVQTYVSRLRQLLNLGQALVSTDAEYLLHADPAQLDVTFFDRHLAAAVQHHEHGDQVAAAGEVAAALALWRGEPMGGLSGESIDAARHRLTEQHLTALELRANVDLDAGRHTAAIADLTRLVKEFPLRERLWALLMHALYRADRQAEALRTYTTARALLVEELGVEPGAGLTRMHQRILTGDPSLARDVPLVGSGRAWTSRNDLPADVADFTGREAELRRLLAALPSVPGKAAIVLAIDGMAGVGKTAPAVHWGHSNRARFPGGLLYVNLRGFDERETVTPREALGRLLMALGRPGDAVPDDVDAAAELFRAATADRGVLVILDNAGGAEQVRPLLPGTGSFTIVTSRDRLTGLVALNDARPVHVGMLGREEAVELLARILGADRVAAEPEAAERLADLCGHLPLALRIAAAHVAGDPGGRIADHVGELERRDRLDVLAVDGDPAAAVTANLDLSYRMLDENARDLFCRMGALPGEDFAQELLIAVSGRSDEDTVRALRRLVAAHLVEQHRSRRYRMHDLVRLYAARSARRDLAEEDRETLIDGFIEWHHDRAYQPIEDEETNVFLACEALRDHRRLWRLVVPLRNTINEWRLIDRVREFVDVAARRAEQLGDSPGLFRMTSMTATAMRREGDSAAAVELGTRALALAKDLSDRERVMAGGNLGIYHHIRLGLSTAEIHVHRGEFDLAADAADAALATARRGSYGHLDMWCMQVQAEIHLHAGRPEPARRAFEEELENARNRNMSYFEPEILCNLVELGEHRKAGELIAEARAKWSKVPRSLQTFVDLVLAGVHNGLGKFEVAAGHARAAVDAYAAMPWPARHELALVALADAHAGLGEVEAARERREQADRIGSVINRVRRGRG